MAEDLLPQELSVWQHLPNIQRVGTNEYSAAACPNPACGEGTDRFRMWPAGTGKSGSARGWCRACGWKGFPDQDENANVTDAFMAQARKRHEAQVKQRKQDREDKLTWLRQSDFWIKAHDEMTKGQIRMWIDEGVEPWSIDTYKLGFYTGYKIERDIGTWHTPTLTIPHWDTAGDLVNLQHKLLNPPQPGDKYRYIANLPAPSFLTEPGEELSGKLVLVEGAKKAMITYIRVGHEYMVAGLPSKYPGEFALEPFANCEPIYLALDPDAYIQIESNGTHADRVADLLGRERVRFVKMVVKPDDAFVRYGMTPGQFLRYIKTATRSL